MVERSGPYREPELLGIGFRMTDISSAQVDGDRLTIADTRSALQVDARLRAQRQFRSPATVIS